MIMDPVTLLLTAIHNRVPDYIVILLVACFCFFLYYQLRAVKDAFTSGVNQQTSYFENAIGELRKDLERTKNENMIAAAKNQSSAETLAATMSSFQIQMVRETPSRLELERTIQASNSAVMDAIQEIRKDVRALRKEKVE
jgi:uncharacterized membrane protein